MIVCYEVSFDVFIIFLINISTAQLQKLGRDLLGLSFLGVYPLEKLPTFKQYGGLIVNTHTSNLAGEHWIAIYVKPNHIKVYDPFGFYYPSMLVDKLSRLQSRIEYNRVPNQHMLTDTCGQYCLLWLTLQFL
jgi:hypothetical protein